MSSQAPASRATAVDGRSGPTCAAARAGAGAGDRPAVRAAGSASPQRASTNSTARTRSCIDTLSIGRYAMPCCSTMSLIRTHHHTRSI
jgi:hypothetical protein